jgi:hypothetical protein
MAALTLVDAGEVFEGAAGVVERVAALAWRVEPLARIRAVEKRIDRLMRRRQRAVREGRHSDADFLVGRIRFWLRRLDDWETRAA